MSESGQETLREQTLANLARTDWREEPLQIRFEDVSVHRTRWRDAVRLALEECLKRGADYVLLLEDGSDFNLHLRHNLDHWQLLKRQVVPLAGMHNPQVREYACDLERRARLFHPRQVRGTKALLVSQDAVRHLVAGWRRIRFPLANNVPGVVARLGGPVFYHAPSLVQAIASTDEGDEIFREALDFDRGWKA